MSNYRPPYGPVAFLFEPKRVRDSMDKANRTYKNNYRAGKGFKDGSR